MARVSKWDKLPEHERLRLVGRIGEGATWEALQVSALGLKGMREHKDPDPKAAKLWSECVAINVNTIRKIRGLDDTTATANITIANPRSFD